MLTLEMIDRAIASMERAQKYEPPHFFVHPNWPKDAVDAALAEYPDAIVHVIDRIPPFQT